MRALFAGVWQAFNCRMRRFNPPNHAGRGCTANQVHPQVMYSRPHRDGEEGLFAPLERMSADLVAPCLAPNFPGSARADRLRRGSQGGTGSWRGTPGACARALGSWGPMDGPGFSKHGSSSEACSCFHVFAALVQVLVALTAHHALHVAPSTLGPKVFINGPATTAGLSQRAAEL